MKIKNSLIVMLLVFSTHSYAEVVVCGRGYVKNLIIHQGSIMRSIQKDKRNVAVSLDSTGFNVSDLPSSTNYWQGSFITAELLWPSENGNAGHYQDSLYHGFLQTLLHAQQARLPVEIYLDPVPANSQGSLCRVGIGDYIVKVCTSEVDCNK